MSCRVNTTLMALTLSYWNRRQDFPERTCLPDLLLCMLWRCFEFFCGSQCHLGSCQPNWRCSCKAAVGGQPRLYPRGGVDVEHNANVVAAGEDWNDVQSDARHAHRRGRRTPHQ